MSLNYEKYGRFLSQIEGSGKDSKKIVSISTDNEDEIHRPFTKIKLTGDNKFQQIPSIDCERQILYITGASGSGKSTYTANFIKKYKKMKKHSEIYCFSSLPDDVSLDVVNPKRIKIDESLVTNPINVKDFEDSLVVFDDIDVISDKKQREAVYSIMNQILEIGRHHKIWCIITNHLPTAGKDTRRVLNEAHSITYFPHSGSARGIKYLLCEYLGLDKKDISKIKKSKSRWATIFKNYPQIAMTDKEIYILAEDDD
jgi:Cdc6-like AAA superfamily ATPase